MSAEPAPPARAINELGEEIFAKRNSCESKLKRVSQLGLSERDGPCKARTQLRGGVGSQSKKK